MMTFPSLSTSSFLNGAPTLSLSAESVSMVRVSKSARTIGDESTCTGMGGSHGRSGSVLGGCRRYSAVVDESSFAVESRIPGFSAGAEHREVARPRNGHHARRLAIRIEHQQRISDAVGI